MDIQFWIWLIIIVLTLVARARKQKAKPQQRQEAAELDEPRGKQGQTQRPLTFDELLREIQSARQPKEVREALPPAEPIKPYRQPEPIFQDVDYDDNVGEEDQDLETAVDDQRTTEAYERAKQEAFMRPSLEETMKLGDTVVKFGHFKGYEALDQKRPIADFLAEFRDPDGFKKAFVMSEILKTKF